MNRIHKIYDDVLDKTLYGTLAIICIVAPALPLNNNLRGSYNIAAALFCIAYELSKLKNAGDKKEK